MTIQTAARRALACAALSCALGFSGAGLAFAEVGVTSATSGDPLGKPPMEQERVLHVGIDVQANEVITTHANDRAHLLFLDGSSLTVGPNAQLVIDKFVFDPASQHGDLAINASKGVLRFVGGKISKTNTVVINTPSSTIGIRGGIAIIEASPSHTVATFVYGQSLSVSSQGRNQLATRPGSQVTTLLGQPPGQPRLVPTGGLAAVMRQLEAPGQTAAGPAGANVGAAIDARAQTFGLQNVVPQIPSPQQVTAISNSNAVTQSVFQSNGGSDQTSVSTTSTTTTSTTTDPSGSSCHACNRQDIFHGHRGR